MQNMDFKFCKFNADTIVCAGIFTKKKLKFEIITIAYFRVP